MNTLNLFISNSQVEKEVRNMLFKHGRPPCISCRQTARIIRLKDGRYWCGFCRKKMSLKQLAGWNASKLPLVAIYQLLFAFLHDWPVKVTAASLRISHVSVRRYYARFRKQAEQYIFKHNGFLDGDVIVDECFLGKKRTNNQTMVIGAVARRERHCRLRIIADRDQGTVEKFLYDSVTPWSLISTDGAEAYNDIGWMGFVHVSENHSKNQLLFTNPIERLWSHLKRMIRRIYGHVTKRLVQEYLTEFQFKFMYRDKHKYPPTFLQFFTLSAPGGLQ
jgi:transposase-like protein